MRSTTTLLSALFSISVAACTSDVSGDGTGPDLGHSTVLASLIGMGGGAQVQAITVDADAVYWTDGQGLYRCAKNGCNMQPTTLFAVPFNGTGASTPFGGVHSLVIGGGYAFWSGGDPQSSRLQACAVTGCPNGPDVLAEVSSNGSFVELQADASGVYWATGNGPTSTIFSCPITGCAKSPKTIAQANSNSGQISFALGDGRIYFWNANNNNTGSGSSLPTGLVSCPESGCTSDVRVHFAISAQPGPGATQQSSVVAVDSKAVYLATQSNTSPGRSLTRCVLPTCTDLETLASAPGASSLVSSDGSGLGQHMFQTADTLYSQLTQCSGNCTNLPTVASCPKTGCPQGPSVRPADPSFPIATSGPGGNNGGGPGNVTIAVDATGIYWFGSPAYYSSARFLVRSPLN